MMDSYIYFLIVPAVPVCNHLFCDHREPQWSRMMKKNVILEIPTARDYKNLTEV